MSDDTVDALLARVAKHCIQHNLSSFSFVLHGGEPLLAGETFFRRFVDKANSVLPQKTTANFSLQTNATLLTPQWCKTLFELNFGMGISIDGPKMVNDQHRVDHFGEGSYDRILRGFELAVSFGLRPGLLTVINVTSDPLEVYSFFKSLGAHAIDFLLPDATYDKPPYSNQEAEVTSYADWLLRVFYAWVAEEEYPFRIRIFEIIMRRFLGHCDSLDSLGTERNELMVIETDGAIEPVDVLKICKDGITKTNLNVHTHDINEAFENGLIQLYHLSGEQLSESCRKCLIKETCGGGYLPHRYSHINEFDNPSVYCMNLMKLITNIQEWVIENIPSHLARDIDLNAVTFNSAKACLLG